MGAALGFLLGTGLNAIGGYAQEKTQQKHQQEAQWQDFMRQHIQSDPQGALAIAGTPEGKKAFESAFGKEHAPAAMQMLQTAAQAQQQEQKQMNDLTAGFKIPNDPDQIRAELPKYEAALGGPHLTDQHKDLLRNHVGLLKDQLGKLETQQGQNQRQAAALAERNTITPYQQAQLSLAQQREKREGSESGLKEKEFGLRSRELDIAEKREAREEAAAPEKKSEFERRQGLAESKEKRITGEGGAKQKLAETREQSRETEAAAHDKLAREKFEEQKRAASVKEHVKLTTGKPWTPTDALSARSKAEAQAKTELGGSMLFGLKAKIPQGDKVKARAEEILADEGLKPNGDRMAPPGAILGRDKATGKVMGYSLDGQWHSL